jgi:hypothetical protein
MDSDRAAVRDMRHAVYLSRVDAIERLDGHRRTLGQRIRAWLERRWLAVLERAERALVLAVLFEIRTLVPRIAATRLHRTNEGLVIHAPQELTPHSQLTRSYTHICSLSMQELSVQFPWFCLLDTLPASRAFLRGAQWASRNPGWNSDTKSNSEGHSSEGS